MDDAMIDLLAGEGMLRRRLEAYADARLSPELAATTRMRARVLAVAHRQAALIRADGALAVVAEDADPAATRGAEIDDVVAAGGPSRTVTAGRTRPARSGRTATRRLGSVLLAACLGLTIAVGTTLAARPGGALYGARIWAETLTLPMAPRERAVAELERLQARLVEAGVAAAAGDTDAAAAALLAYETILAAASTEALEGGDPVALAALEAGVGHNIEVLTALLERVPTTAQATLSRVIEGAVERSEGAVRDIRTRPAGGNGHGGDGGAGGDGGQGPATPMATPTPAPDAGATPTPTKTPKPEATPRPTRTPRETDRPTPDPTKAPAVDPTADPTSTPRPERTPRPVDEETRPTPDAPGRP